jgi:hypothetical protein
VLIGGFALILSIIATTLVAGQLLRLFLWAIGWNPERTGGQ